MKKIAGIQILRAVACISVLIQHSLLFSCIAKSYNFDKVGKIDFGDFGVYLFFCISGFVIGMQYNYSPLKFISRRAMRIYPAYWLAIGISFIFLGLIPEMPKLTLDSFFLIPLNVVNLNNSYYIPYWTLIYEVAFYVIFFLLLCFFRGDRKMLASSIFLWIAVLIFSNIYLGDSYFVAAPGWLIVLSRVNICFCAGSLTALVFRDIQIENKLLGIVATSAIILAMTDTIILKTILFYSIGFCSLIILMDRIEIKNKLLVSIGNASYGVYLVHMIIIYALFSISKHTAYINHINLFTLFIFMFSIAGLFGFIFGLVENKLHMMLVNKFFGKKNAVLTKPDTPIMAT